MTQLKWSANVYKFRYHKISCSFFYVGSRNYLYIQFPNDFLSVSTPPILPVRLALNQVVHERGQYQHLELMLSAKEKTLADVKSNLMHERFIVIY